MKKLLLVSLFFLLKIAIFAQADSLRSNTIIGIQNIKIGTIIKREFIDLASYRINELFTPGTGNIDFKILHLTDAGTGVKTAGSYVSTSELSGGLRNYQILRYHSYIDQDEIDAFIKYLEFVSVATEKEEKTDVEYVFNSKDLHFVTFNNRKKNASYYWNFAIQVNKLYNGSKVYIHFKEVSDLLQKLKQRRNEVVRS